MDVRVKKLTLYIFFLSTVSLLSCKKFLTTYSQNKTFITSAEDLTEVLVGDGYLLSYNNSSVPFLYSMDDDVKLATFQNRNKSVMDIGFHYWQDNPWVNSDGVLLNTDNYFNILYSKIVRLNNIFSNVSVLKERGGASEKLEPIAGEAFFLRAYYNFLLVNIYGKPYKTSTANKDLGVPLKTDPAVEDQFARRATTEIVYNQILADLKEAEKRLQGVNDNSNIRANLAAVHALLSRVHLFMENYEQSILYADKVIANQRYLLFDLNTYNVANNFASKQSSEVIFSMGNNYLFNVMGLQANEYTSQHYLPSDELVSLYSSQDLRRTAFFVQNSKGVWKFAKKKTIVNTLDDASDFYLIRLPEVYLNKAEALAILGRDVEARTVLQQFCRYRFRPDQLTDITADGEALVNIIRDERRREFCMEAHRWFDLRRYAVNSKFPFMKTIRHQSIGFTGTAYEYNGYYELGTYAEEPGAYVVPICNDEIEFNRGSITNEPRPARPLKQ